MTFSLTNRIESHNRSGGLTGLAEPGDVHGINSELVLQALDQAGHLVMAIGAGQLVLPHPQDGVPLLLLNPVPCHLAATVSIRHIPMDADGIGRHRHHIWTSWRTWRYCGKKLEVGLRK